MKRRKGIKSPLDMSNLSRELDYIFMSLDPYRIKRLMSDLEDCLEDVLEDIKDIKERLIG